MSDFSKAIPVILKHEGGWVSDPADPGGETNFGISMLIIKREGLTKEQLGIQDWNPGCLKFMNQSAAVDIYKKLFWDRYGYSSIVDQNVATKIFDCGVNCGPGRAHGMAQRVATALGNPTDVDGKIGPKTIKAINACDPLKFITAFRSEMETYYDDLVARKPALQKFLWIWMKRAAWVG